MIKVENSTVEISGSMGVPQIAEEVCFVLRAARERITELSEVELADKMIEQALRLSKMDTEEVRKEATDKRMELLLMLLGIKPFETR